MISDPTTYVFLAIGAAALWSIKRLAGPAVDRLAERIADWVFPRDRAASYRLALLVIRVCAAVAPPNSPAHANALAALRELQESRHHESLPLQPASVALSLVRPSFWARATRQLALPDEPAVEPLADPAGDIMRQLEPVEFPVILGKTDFYVGQVCQMVGISKMQLDYWTVKAQIATKGKKQRIYDIDALTQVLVIKQAKDLGANLGVAIDVLDRYMRERDYMRVRDRLNS